MNTSTQTQGVVHSDQSQVVQDGSPQIANQPESMNITPVVEAPTIEHEKSHTMITEQPAPPEYSKEAPGENIISIPVSVPLNQLGEEPAQIDCPNCHMTTTTFTRKVDPGPDSSTHTCALVLCCLVGPLFAWMPYAFRTKKYDTFHDCSNCRRPLAYKEHDGVTKIIPLPLPVGVQLQQQQQPGAGNAETPRMVYERQVGEMRAQGGEGQGQGQGQGQQLGQK